MPAGTAKAKSPAKPPSEESSPVAKQSLAKQVGLTLLVVGSVGAGMMAIWQQVRARALAHDIYRLKPEHIATSEPPAWIRADIKAEVLRSSGLDTNASILDEDLAQRVHAAFKLHPWVAEVVQVRKSYPAAVEVEILYRRPEAMVEVQGGLLPIDANGVVLPSEDFSPLEAAKYLRIEGISGGPRGPLGTPWGDPSVAGAAEIAVQLRRDWPKLGLKKIVPVQTVEPEGGGNLEFDLITASGRPIRWGRAPASAGKDELAPADKLSRLRQHLQQHGSLDEAVAAGTIDLRRPAPIR